jgi:hypothetical protein
VVSPSATAAFFCPSAKGCTNFSGLFAAAATH